MAFGIPFGQGAQRSFLTPATIALGALNLLFVLWLAFVSLGAAGYREREIPMELAVVAEGTSFVRLSPREVIVRVDAAGGIRAGHSTLGADELERRLERLASDSSDMTVTIRADARAPYGTVAKVLAATRKAGFRDVSLLVVMPPGSERRAP